MELALDVIATTLLLIKSQVNVCNQLFYYINEQICKIKKNGAI